MNIQKNFFLLCENAVIGERGKISLINIYEIIFAEKLPAMHGKLIFAANFSIELEKKDTGKLIISLSIKSPTGKSMLKEELQIEKELDKSKKKQIISDIIEVNGVVVSEYGKYKATLSMDGKGFEYEFEARKPAN